MSAAGTRGGAPDTRWILLDARGDEPTWFRDADAALALAEREPVLPPNAHREVRRVVAPGGGVYYLKRFFTTQRKNRLRNRLTAPRCRLDAEREALVAAALRERGIATARGVALAIGPRGASAWLCAELPGTSLREHLAQHPESTALLRAAVHFCGAIAEHGVVLPDLSPDHLFVLRDGPAAEFAVIDLHNGRLARRWRRRDAIRALRRSARSLAALRLPRRMLLAAACRFLAAAGLREQARAVLRALPPIDTHARYDAPRSRAYATRSGARTSKEQALLEAVWPGRRGDVVLDSPCGNGRLAVPLAALGARHAGADASLPMLRDLRTRAPTVACVLADALELPFADRSVDGVVVSRFLHHLPRAAAAAAVAEAARVADRFVVATFFHPVSLHNAVRRVTELCTGRARTRHTLTLRALRGMLLAHGFRVVSHRAQVRWLRDFWIAAFVRERA